MTIFFLVFNGIHIGAAAGYANYACNPESFWTFVAGHSSFELLGMVVAGVAGMRLGLGVLKPGAELCFATDFLDYGELVMELLDGFPGLAVEPVLEPWPDGARTNYEAKYQREERPIQRLEVR